MKKAKLTKISRRLHKLAVMEWNEYALTCDVQELIAIAKDETESVYKRITARALLKALKEGNLHILGWVYDHTYGKPSQQIQLDAEINHTHENIKSMTTAQIIRMIKSDVKALEGEK